MVAETDNMLELAAQARRLLRKVWRPTMPHKSAWVILDRLKRARQQQLGLVKQPAAVSEKKAEITGKLDALNRPFRGRLDILTEEMNTEYPGIYD